MKIGEKIKQERINRKYKIKDFLDFIAINFPQEQISEGKYMRLEKSDDIKFSTLRVFCAVFGMTIKDLVANTTLETRMIIKKNQRQETYKDPKNKYFYETLTSSTMNILSQELVIDAGGKTLLEYAPKNNIRYEKWLYVLTGTLTLHLGEETHILKVKSGISFLAHIPHWYENKGEIKCTCIVVKSPKYL